MKKLAIIVAAHDGLVSLLTGVGVVVNSFVESFGEIKEKCGILRENKIELICLAPYLSENSKDYNPKIKEKTKQVCESNSGKLVDLPTNSDGSSQSSVWGGPSQWRSASLSVANYIKSIYNNYDFIILFANDTIFSSVRKYIPSHNKLKVIWVPHSLGLVFKDEFSDSERLSIEKESIESMQTTQQDVIGYVNKFFRDVLHKEYSIRNEKLVPFINGIYKKSSRFNIPDSVMHKAIKVNNIPLNKKIIFCWGRCTYQKGQDILIPAYNKFLRDNPRYHLVLLMPTETSQSEYLDKIKEEVSMLPNESVTAIYDFKDTLPYSVLHHPNIKLVIFPSRFEGAPITPLEALSFTNDVNFVYSGIPPLLEIFKENNRAVSVHDLTVDSLCEGMKLATKKEKSLAKENIVSNFVNSYVRGLNIAMEVK